jgi:hypothetical protein
VSAPPSPGFATVAYWSVSQAIERKLLSADEMARRAPHLALETFVGAEDNWLPRTIIRRTRTDRRSSGVASQHRFLPLAVIGSRSWLPRHTAERQN